VALPVLGLQLAWLLFRSVELYHRFALTSDFALFFQAWHLIAAGHLDPTGTIYRQAPFLTNHFELIVYPLALLSLVFPSGLTLLVVQDLACVAAELVAFWWLLDLVDERWPAAAKGRGALAAGSLVVLAIDPWIVWANAFDFHLEAFATLFALLAARSFWHRRTTAWVWVALTLCCGTVESIVLIGLGATLALLRRDLRWPGLAVVGAGIAWLGSLNALGYDAGSQLNSQYAYLTNPALLSSPRRAAGTHVSLPSVLLGALRHPRTVGRFLGDRRLELWRFLAGSGFLGLFTWVGLPISLVLLIPGALNYSPYVLNPQSSFQVLPVLLFVPVGTVVALCWLANRHPRWRAVGAALGVAALIQVVALSVVWLPRAQPFFSRVDPQTAQVLSSVLARTPSTDEVVASNGVVGRFAARPWIYSYLGTRPGQSMTVGSRTVEFVFAPSQGIETACPAQYSTDEAISYVEHRLGGRLVRASAGIDVLVWHPPAGIRTFSLPVLPAVLPPGAHPCT